jgi:hypothetical protein
MFNVPSFFGFKGAGEPYVGLLDLYPGAAAAYSLRRLNGAYTGAAIQVRRTDLAVMDIGFVGEDLNTAALLAFTGTGPSDNGFITEWYDQSGNGKNATQTLALNQPQIVSSGSVITENGKPAVDFDGIDDFLSIPSSTSYFNFLHDGTISAVIGVAKLLNTSIDNNLSVLIGSSSLNASSVGYSLYLENRDVLGNPNQLKSVVFNGAGGVGGFVLENITTTSGQLQNLYIDLIDADNAIVGDRSLHYINSGSVSKNNVRTPNPTSSNATNNFSISNSSFRLVGNAQEIIIYPSDQSTNRTGIETNINDFYSIY